jgi:PilZ domain
MGTQATGDPPALGASDSGGPGPENRRRHTRTDLSAPARLAVPGGWDLPGLATSLAFGGAFFVPEAPAAPPPAVGEGAMLTLHAPEAGGPIVFTCRVARAAPGGIGLKFLATDPAGFERFADLIVLGVEGSGRLVEELRVSPAFEVATGEGLRRALD